MLVDKGADPALWNVDGVTRRRKERKQRQEDHRPAEESWRQLRKSAVFNGFITALLLHHRGNKAVAAARPLNSASHVRAVKGDFPIDADFF